MPNPDSSTRDVLLIPFRGEFHVVFACENMEHAEIGYEGMIGMLEAAGAIADGGSMEVMDRADVIPGSPLDKALRDG